MYVREDAIVAKLDAWLAGIVTPEALAAAQTPPADIAARDAVARAKIADCDLRIGRVTASVEDGMPRDWIAAQVVKLPAERDQIERSLPDRRDYTPLTPGEIAAITDSLGGLINILQNASPTDRAAVYQKLGINLTYNPTANQIHALADLARVGCRVEGPTSTPSTRAAWRATYLAA